MTQETIIAKNDRSSKYLTLSLKPGSIVSAVVDGAAALFKGDSAGAGLALAKSLQLKATPEHRAWVLILSATARALKAVLGAYASSHDFDVDRLGGFVAQGFASPILEIQLNADFLINPQPLALIDQLRPHLQKGLESIDISPVDAQNLIDRLPGYVTISLHNEWRASPEYYQALLDNIESPFSGAVKREVEWTYYKSQLVSARDEPIFEESFSLRQIFIPPRAYYNDRQSGAGATIETLGELGAQTARNTVVDLSSYIDSWVDSDEPSFTSVVISGGPGSGKSSYAKMLASVLASRDCYVLFVPLHQLDLELGIAASIGAFFRETRSFGDSPLDHLGSVKRLILILDGLDELQMQGKALQDSVRDLIMDLLRYLDRANLSGLRVLSVVTGRELAVQSTEALFRVAGQVLHLIPYHANEARSQFLGAPSEATSYFDPGDLLVQDQRDAWWKKYGELTGLGYAGVPGALRKGELNEVTVQPLLNYLVALSYRRGGLTLASDTNINFVYRDLLEAVHERSWAAGVRPAVQTLTFDDFTRLLEEVALSIWHGAGRTTTLREVEEHCDKAGLTKLLPAFEAGVSTSVSNLLLAFYFRQKDRRADGEKTFEFTHKSFGEYLVSLRSTRTVQQVSRQLNLYRASPDEGWSEEECLFRWTSIFGESDIDQYLQAFIIREVATLPVESVREWQDTLVELISFSLAAGWPMNRFPGLKFAEQARWARNAESALVICLNACARATEQRSDIKWPNVTAFGDLLKRLQGQRGGAANRAFQSSLSFTNFDNSVLHMADLYGANLANASLREILAEYASFTSANLSGADLTGANFGQTFMDDANLDGAIFSQESLIKTGIAPLIFDLDYLANQGSSTSVIKKKRAALFSNLRGRGAVITEEKPD